LSHGLLLLLSFAEHKVITIDSTIQNMVVSGIFISLSWVYLATFEAKHDNKKLKLSS